MASLQYNVMFRCTAIAGMKRLKDQKDLTDRPTVQATRQAYIRRSDSCHAFVMDKLTDTAEFEDQIFDADLYRAFIKYCVDKKLTRHSKGELTKSISQYTPGAEHTKALVDPDNKDNRARKPCWRYLKYRTETERPQAKDGKEPGKIDGY